MPIEIRELVIRATVEPDGAKPGGGCGGGSSGGKPADKAHAGESGEGSLVQDCVREVLRILEAKQER